MKITGQDVTIRIVHDGAAVDTGAQMRIDSITFERDSKPHPLGDLGQFTITMQAAPAQQPAWEAFCRSIAEHGRAQRIRALAAHILAGHWVGQMFAHEHGWFWWVICRLEHVDGGQVIQRYLGCTFDNQADPNKGTWTHGPFPAPTLDDLVGQLERSERPWTAMEVGSSGFVDTICAPKVGTP